MTLLGVALQGHQGALSANAEHRASVLIGAFRRAALKAEKFQDEPEPTPAKVFVFNTSLFNNSDGEVRITDITYAVNGPLGGAPYSFGGKASQTHPQLLPISWDELGMLTGPAMSLSREKRRTRPRR